MKRFVLFYMPPCGTWYVHSHKMFDTVEAAMAAAKKFLHPDTPIFITSVTLPAN